MEEKYNFYSIVNDIDLISDYKNFDKHENKE